MRKQDNDTAREWAREKRRMKKMMARKRKENAQFELAVETVLDGLEMFAIEMPNERIAALVTLVYIDMTELGSTQEQIWQQMAKSAEVTAEKEGREAYEQGLPLSVALTKPEADRALFVLSWVEAAMSVSGMSEQWYLGYFCGYFSREERNLLSLQDWVDGMAPSHPEGIRGYGFGRVGRVQEAKNKG